MQDQVERKYALLVQGTRVGEVQIRGIFDTPSEASEFAEEELGRGEPFEIEGARYY